MTPPEPTTSTAIPAIERELDLAAGPERVWRALTDEQELAAWFGAAVSFRAEVGADGWVEWPEHGRFALGVESVDAPSRLSWRWARDPGVALSAGPNTLVEFQLSPGRSGGTRLRLRESGFERPADRASNSRGWLEELGDLLAHLATVPHERGIRRRYRLASSVERVWEAFTDPAQLGRWWGGTGHLEVRTGFEGWWEWDGMGRFGMRFDAVEPMSYLAWRWTPHPDVPVADATEVLRTEWALVARPDGGTDLHLLESGFTEDEGFRMNDGGWDGDVLPALERVLANA
jgi:uncharacterized protein YndB with AHSA1/START domain